MVQKMIYNHCVVGLEQESLLGIEQAKENQQQVDDVRSLGQINSRQLGPQCLADKRLNKDDNCRS